MKFSEELLKELNLESIEEKEPVNVMKVSEMLQFLNLCANRIVQKSEKFVKTQNADEQLDCIDIVTVKLNDFVQVFKDLIIFMRKEEGTYKNGISLRYCMSSYDTFTLRERSQPTDRLQCFAAHLTTPGRWVTGLRIIWQAAIYRHIGLMEALNAVFEEYVSTI